MHVYWYCSRLAGLSVQYELKHTKCNKTVKMFNTDDILKTCLKHEILLKIYKAKLKKGKGRALDIAPQVDTGHHWGARVHGAHQAASHVPALYLPSYIAGTHLPTPRGWRGWVSPGPGCKEQLAHGCYTTASRPLVERANH